MASRFFVGKPAIWFFETIKYKVEFQTQLFPATISLINYIKKNPFIKISFIALPTLCSSFLGGGKKFNKRRRRFLIFDKPSSKINWKKIIPLIT